MLSELDTGLLWKFANIELSSGEVLKNHEKENITNYFRCTLDKLWGPMMKQSSCGIQLNSTHSQYFPA